MDARATIADLERRLAESETRQRLLIESWAQAVWETDAAGAITADSPSWRAYTGQTLRELLGYGWLDAIHPDDRAYAEQQWREAIAAYELVDAEFRLRTPTGSWRWTNVRAAPIRDETGKIAKWAGINIDIDARKRAEAALREREADLARLQRIGGVGGLNIDINGGMRSWRSPEYLRLHGLPEGTTEETHEDWLARVHPEDRDNAQKTLLASLKSDASLYENEYRIVRHSDGGIRWIQARADIERDGKGRAVRLVGVHLDVTAQKLAEEAVRASEEKHRSLFETMAQGYCEIELIRNSEGHPVDQHYLELNPAFESIFGIPVANAIGRTASEVFPGHEEWTELLGRVAGTGQSQRLEYPLAPLNRWYEVFAYARPGDRIAMLYSDITERKQAEVALRQSEERQSFLLRFGDALRAESDADTVADRAIRTLAAQMELDRCYLATYRLEEDLANITHQFGNDRLPPMPETIRLSDFPEAFRETLEKTLVFDDVRLDERLSPEDRQNMLALGFGAFLAPTLRKGPHRPLWVVVAVSAKPRRWTQGEIALVEEAAERTWAAMERARAEAALRESEERFRQFAAASSAGLWIRNADTLAMEFVSPAIATIYGVGQDALLGEVTRWAALIVPEDRDATLDHLDRARHGDVAVHEFRIQRPSDGAFRWVRNVDFLLRDDGRIPRIGGIAEDVTEARLAAEHSAVLLAELQHRVRNTMALLRSIAGRTAERAESVPEYRDLMMGRLLAFARVQALLTRAANVSVGITSIVHDEVSVQARHEGQYVLDGPDVALSPKASEVLTLAIHELATNAVKYGALSVPDGKVTVRWSTFEKRGGPWLSFDWTEEGAPARPAPASDTPRRRGFGSELIEARIPYELRGRGQVTIGPGGARCHLEFPLQGGPSILETGAPQRATVFGGAIDMTGEPDLKGRRVLVVEDDYYLATDTARALRGAGAEVIGPCATEADALAELAAGRPDAVVVDINLGPGPSFKVAETLKDRGIPFVFTTGYDAEAIPAQFAGIERLEKPLQPRQIVGAVARLTAAT